MHTAEAHIVQGSTVNGNFCVILKNAGKIFPLFGPRGVKKDTEGLPW